MLDRLKTPLLALFAGLLFGAGLLISGMANPAKVINFLDVAGNWDPSLAFVTGGAVVCTVFGFAVAKKRKGPLLAEQFELPTRNDVDKPLVVGAMLFGLGWGVSGYCPGPLWASILGLAPGTVVFAVAMLAGMWATSLWKRRQSVR